MGTKQPQPPPDQPNQNPILPPRPPSKKQTSDVIPTPECDKLAEYFNINLEKVEQERLAILKNLRDRQRKTPKD